MASHGHASHGRAKRLLLLRFRAVVREIGNQWHGEARPGGLGISSSVSPWAGHARPARKIFYCRPPAGGPGVSGPSLLRFGGAHAHRSGFWPLSGRGSLGSVEGRAGVSSAGPGRGYGFVTVGAGVVL
jgi:hypothetical protein